MTIPEICDRIKALEANIVNQEYVKKQIDECIKADNKEIENLEYLLEQEQETEQMNLENSFNN